MPRLPPWPRPQQAANNISPYVVQPICHRYPPLEDAKGFMRAMTSDLVLAGWLHRALGRVAVDVKCKIQPFHNLTERNPNPTFSVFAQRAKRPQKGCRKPLLTPHPARCSYPQTGPQYPGTKL